METDEVKPQKRPGIRKRASWHCPGTRRCEPQQRPLIKAAWKVSSALCLAMLLRVADPRSYGVG
jgi:hypothetical protein